MKQSPSWEASSCSASEEIHRLQVHKGPPMNLSWTRWLQLTTWPTANIILPRIPTSRLFPAGFLSNNYAFLISPMPTACPPHHPWFVYRNNSLWRTQIMKLVMQLSPSSCIFLPVRSKISSSAPCSRTPLFLLRWGTSLTLEQNKISDRQEDRGVRSEL
jgi:hypothetical protein